MNARPDLRRDMLLIGLAALIVGGLAAARIAAPGYTDAYYYFNGGQRLVQGNGLTDAALWTYIGTGGVPEGLPVPSHLYWMPLTSFVAAGGMLVGGANFNAAQIGFVLLYAALVLLGFWLGTTLGKSRRVAWLAGLLTLFSGFFMPYWFTTATFGPFGLAGAGALITMGLGRRAAGNPGAWRWFALSGACSGLAHLARADGLLLLFVLILVAVWPPWKGSKPTRAALVGVLAYLVLMTPWFARNLSQTGQIFPVGGLETAWMRSYDEIFNYPPGIDIRRFFTWGVGNILESRWQALVQNALRFVAEQGMIVLAPLLVVGLWRRRRDPLLAGVLLYAPGLFALMTFVFTFPGTRGGLFHSAASLVPFWAALGALGLDDVVAWFGRWRRWNVAQARLVFGVCLLVWAIWLSLSTLNGKTSDWVGAGAYFRTLPLPAEAVVMINDPSALYYFTGLPGVVLPNAPPETLNAIARRYGVTHIVLDLNTPAPLETLWLRRNVPVFLEHRFYDGTTRIYTVRDNYNAPD